VKNSIVFLPDREVDPGQDPCPRLDELTPVNLRQPIFFYFIKTSENGIIVRKKLKIKYKKFQGF